MAEPRPILGGTYVELLARGAVLDEAESGARAGGDHLGDLNEARDEPIPTFGDETSEAYGRF
jgi:hypothetical protein